jgi:RNA polymerase primary sigma factor
MDSLNSKPSVDIPIIDLLDPRTCSAYLLRAFRMPSYVEKLKIKSIRDFLADEDLARENILPLLHMSTVAFDELKSLVNAYMEIPNPDEMKNPFEKKIRELQNEKNNISSKNPTRDMPLIEFVNENSGSVRLCNSLLGTSNESFPIKTLGDYVDNRIYSRTELMKLRNFGRKTLNELEELILEHAYDLLFNMSSSENNKEVKEDKKTSPPEYFKTTLKSLVQENLVSVRLCNAILDVSRNNEFPIKTVGDYLEGKKAARKELLSLRNMGRKSLNELDGIIDEYIKSSSLQNISNKKKTIIDGENETEKPAEKYTEEKLKENLIEVLGTKEVDILFQRHGINCQRQTLEEVGEKYSVTRERIRQIEKKSLLRIRKFLNSPRRRKVFNEWVNENIRKYGIEDKKFVLNDRVSDVKKTLPPAIRLAVEISSKSIRGWLDENFKKNQYGWVLSDLPEDYKKNINILMKNRDTGKISIAKMIEKIADKEAWPLSIEKIALQLPELSKSDIENHFLHKMGGEIQNGFLVKANNIRPTKRLIYVLRHAKRALHLSEIRAQHKQLFGSDINEHAIQANINRLEEVLIVERGTYDLYENMKLNDVQIKIIKNRVRTYLKKRDEFISVKVIYAQMFKNDLGKYGKELTDYMLYGILQDDKRFVIKRGLMVGLVSFDIEKSFMPLADTVDGYVRQNGPISIKEIQERISDRRQVFDSTIIWALNSSTEIVACDGRRFDLVSKVIGKNIDVRKLDFAFEVSLLEGPIGLHKLMHRLNLVGLVYSPATVNSWIRKKVQYSGANGLYYMEKASPFTLRYQAIYDKYNVKKIKHERLRETIRKKMAKEDDAYLVDYDYRFIQDNNFKSSPETLSMEDNNIIDEILQEFDF